MQDDNQQSGWSYQPEAAAPPVVPTVSDIQWTASEYIAHQKSSGWFLYLALAVLALAGIVFWIGDLLSAIMVIVAGILFGVFAARPPRTLDYAVDNAGLHIGHKVYDWNLFKSFAIHQEGAVQYLSLNPMKRFMPGLTLYFLPQEGEKIVDAISNYLPIENSKESLTDKLMRQIRF